MANSFHLMRNITRPSVQSNGLEKNKQTLTILQESLKASQVIFCTRFVIS